MTRRSYILEAGEDYAGTSSNVATERCGSANPRTHFSDALVLNFSKRRPA